MKKLLFIIPAYFLFCSLTNAQDIKATTENEKKVILNTNGSWVYAAAGKSEPVPAAGASDCSSYIETTEDKVTGRKTTSSKETIIVSKDGGKKGFGIYLMQGSKGSLIFSIQAVGAESNCIDEGAKINILFTDGSRMELASNSDVNCKGNATVYFGGVFGKKKQMDELQAKKIQTMRVWTSRGYVEEDFTTDQSTQIMQAAKCLINQ